MFKIVTQIDEVKDILFHFHLSESSAKGAKSLKKGRFSDGLIAEYG